jgi:CHAT domain-containing protein
MIGRRGRRAVLLAALAALGVLTAARAGAQTPAPAPVPAPLPWASLDVADSLLASAVFAAGPNYENLWNQLFVAELRAISGSKNALVTEQAAHLLDLERRIARVEPDTLGTHIGSDALVLRYRWVPSERDQRIDGAVAESLGVLAQARNQLDRADSHYRAALKIYRSLGERRREAWVAGTLGQVAYLRGQVARADSIYRDALLLRRRLGDPRLVGNTLNALGITSQALSRNTEAYAFFNEARAVREPLPDRVALANTLNLLGSAAASLGEPDSAMIWYGQALALGASMGDSVRTAETLMNLGALQASTGDLRRAAATLERARAIALQRDDPRLGAMAENSIADLHRRRGHFAAAVASLERAIAYDEALGDLTHLCTDLTDLGRVAVGMRDPGLGRPPLQRLLALADSLKSPALAVPGLVDLAMLQGADGDSRGAERLGLKAFAAAVTSRDSALIHGAATTVGQILAERGDWKEARPWFERALGAGRGLGETERAGDEHHLAAASAHLGRLDEAERLYRAAMERAQRAGAPDAVWPALLGLGDAAARRGDVATALAYGRRAAGLVDTLRAAPGDLSIAWFARRQLAFEALIHLLGRLEPRYPDSGYAVEAFQWAERARARPFLDFVTGGNALSAAPTPTLRQAQDLLGTDHEALLEYSVGDSSTSLWLVTRRATRHYLLAPRATLRARAEILRRGLGDPTGAVRPATLTASHGLYDLVLGAAAKDLVGIDQLVISSDDALALVPFEALLAGEVPPENALPERGSYLGERFTISYAPSAAVLAALRAPGRAAAVVALGDPAFGADSAGRRGLGPLPASADEVAALKAAAGNRRFAGLTGAQATRTRLLGLPELGDAGLIHLATHGLADEHDPSSSGLWLAAEGGSPGFLSVEDIQRLRLNAEIVTLSACETGLDRLERGEGVAGLQRAFLGAGARSVILSLWRVNDRSTAQLMEAFYRALLQHGQSREEALAQAKRALLAADPTRSPYYWAPFVLVGGRGRYK